jgi:SAM-dependent methyltransferase
MSPFSSTGRRGIHTKSAKYLALGDSYAIGESVTSDRRWSGLLTNQLSERRFDVNEKDCEWLWDILACPECRQAVVPSEDGQETVCTNSGCGYHSERKGRVLNLLPVELDRFKSAEESFRVEAIAKRALGLDLRSEQQHAAFRLLNVATSYLFTSQYLFFRDVLVTRYTLKGRGLEIGGATGHHSGFIKLFFPETEMVTSDVAPVNVELAEKLSDLLGFGTEYFIAADAERLPFLPNSFDFIFSSGMLHHLGDLRRGLEEGYTVLKPGGLWYAINELSIGSIARLYWNSRWGQKGKWARAKGIRESSYTYREWRRFFIDAQFKIVDHFFHRDPRHKLKTWTRSAYYAFISKLPISLLKWGIPCEICFVLQKD